MQRGKWDRMKETVAMDKYIMRDYPTPGISFSIESGSITLFKTTPAAIGYPVDYRFLFSPDGLIFGIEPFGIDDGGAHRLPEKLKFDHYGIKSKDLVRFIYPSCGWARKLTYRVPGVRESPDSHTVYFDLRQAPEVHEGRVKQKQPEILISSLLREAHPRCYNIPAKSDPSVTVL